MVNMESKDTKGQTLITHDSLGGTVTHPIGWPIDSAVITVAREWVYVAYEMSDDKVAKKRTKMERDMESQRKDRELWRLRQREANRRK